MYQPPISLKPLFPATRTPDEKIAAPKMERLSPVAASQAYRVYDAAEFIDTEITVVDFCCH